MKSDSSNIVLKGTWVYGDSAELSVQITKTTFKPGSGDFLDPDDLRKDQSGTFYSVQHYSHEGELVSEIQGCESLEQAKKIAKKNCKGLKWLT